MTAAALQGCGTSAEPSPVPNHSGSATGGAAGSATTSGGAASSAGSGGASSGGAGAGSPGTSGAGGGGGSGGSGGGSSGSAGSAGAGFGGFSYGGSSAGPTRTCEVAEGPDALLDDFEDEDASINVTDNRNGKWSFNGDGTAEAIFTGHEPSPGSGLNGSVGWCSAASGHTTWGANIVLNPLSPACGYDASIYKGVCFWAKGKVDAGGPIEFGVGTGDTVATYSGGACVLAANCWYGFMAPIEDLDPNEYKEYCYGWDELAQWEGTPEAARFELDPESLVQMEWKFTARGAEAPTNGELCIDDVRFMTE